MATATFETVLELARQLTPEDQQRLRAELGTPSLAAELSADKRARLAAWFATSDTLAQRVSAAWQGDMTAVDAVAEQRREL